MVTRADDHGIVEFTRSFQLFEHRAEHKIEGEHLAQVIRKVTPHVVGIGEKLW